MTKNTCCEHVIMRHLMHSMTWFCKQASYFNKICCPIMYTLWIYWTSKVLVSYIQSSVCLRLSQFSQSSFMLHMGLWLFSFPISLMMIVRAHVLYHVVIIKSVWPSMTNLLLFRDKSWNKKYAQYMSLCIYHLCITGQVFLIPIITWI